MLANLRRKVGMITGKNTPVPTMPPPTIAESMIVSPTFADLGSGQQPFTMEELGFVWPSDRGIFSPSAIPVWLQEQVRLCTHVHTRPISDFCPAEFDGSWFACQWI
jgi:hypothetical protein